jgi:hypothetical protein
VNDDLCYGTKPGVSLENLELENPKIEYLEKAAGPRAPKEEPGPG